MSAMKNCRIWSVGEPKIEIQFSGRKVVGRECVLNLPWEGQFSVLIDDLRSKLSGGQIKISSAAELTRAFEALCQSVARGSNGYVNVKRAGPGPTEKSIRIKCKARKESQGGEMPEAQHTITVPVSQVVAVGRKLYLARWVAKKTIRERVYKEKGWPIVQGESIWPEAERVWAEIFAGPFAAFERMERERAEMEERSRSDQATEVKLIRRTVEETAPDQADIERAQRLALKRERIRLARLAKQETISHVTVEHDWWTSKRVRRLGTFFVKHTSRLENVTLRYAGTRVYIITEDGERIATRKNVRIIVPD